MTSLSNFENLANEILLEIFDHLRPIDIIHAFNMLNNRLQILLYHRRMHIDLSTNISLNEFNEYCSNILMNYSTCIYSIRLSNIETCGGMKIFFKQFSQLHLIFPNLNTMSFIEPNENDYQIIQNFKHLTNIHIKFRKNYEREIFIGSLFDNSQLETCILSYNDIFSINKFRPNSSLRRLILDSFYINDLHYLFHFYPSLEYLIIHRLTVCYPGFLPTFSNSIQTLHTLKLNCNYTVRFDYLIYLLVYFPQLIRLTIIAIGLDYFNSKQWINILISLKQLRSLLLDIKAVSTIFDDQYLSLSTEFWHQWRIAIDYSQDNQKYHLYTIPYRRTSFISTIHRLSIIQASNNAFHSITDLYLKTNMPMEIHNEQRIYPNVRALQIYQNNIISINQSLLFEQIHSMIYLNKLTHFELFISINSSIFLQLLELTSSLRVFKTDYDILMILTDHLQNEIICNHLSNKLDRFILRHGALPYSDNNRFLEIFSRLKYLQINLNTIEDLRRITLKFIKTMHRLLILQIFILNINQSNDGISQWEGIMNNISYEITKHYVKIWK